MSSDPSSLGVICLQPDQLGAALYQPVFYLGHVQYTKSTARLIKKSNIYAHVVINTCCGFTLRRREFLNSKHLRLLLYLNALF